MFRKFWNNVLQINQEYPARYVSNCKPRCLKRCTTTFTPEHSVSLPWVVGNSEVVPSTQQCCPHTAFSVKELSVHQITVLLHEPNSPDLSPCDFSYSHDWNKLLKPKTLQTFWPFKQPWQTAVQHFRKYFPELFSKTSRNGGSSVLIQKEAQECKHIVLIFMPSVPVLCGHRL
jgi:hypothetical protein